MSPEHSVTLILLHLTHYLEGEGKFMKSMSLEVDIKLYTSTFEFIPFIRRVIQFIMYFIF